MPRDYDSAVLLDIVRACERIAAFCEGMNAAIFASDEKTCAAVERQIIIIGEAANRLGETTRTQTPTIPWNDIVRMRHLVVHHYGKVRADELWQVVVRDAPTLLRTIRESFPTLDSGDGNR